MHHARAGPARADPAIRGAILRRHPARAAPASARAGPAPGALRSSCGALVARALSALVAFVRALVAILRPAPAGRPAVILRPVVIRCGPAPIIPAPSGSSGRQSGALRALVDRGPGAARAHPGGPDWKRSRGVWNGFRNRFWNGTLEPFPAGYPWGYRGIPLGGMRPEIGQTLIAVGVRGSWSISL